MKKYGILLGTAALLASASTAWAQTPSPNGIFDSVAVYAGQGVDHDLGSLPGAIIHGRVNWDPTHFIAVGLGKTAGALGEWSDRLRSTPLAGIRYGYEALLVKHRGLQSNAELGAAFLLRSPDLNLGPLAANLAAGGGLSYALGTPSYEDGPLNNPQQRYRLQYLGLWETEWRVRGIDHLSLALRVHHRSGIYGIIAPRHVGSNFLAAGLRYRF